MSSFNVCFTKKVLVCCLSLLACNVYAQTLFRWVDDTGRVHYADRPAQENVREEQRLDRTKIGATRDNIEAQKDLAKTLKTQAENKRLQEEAEKKAHARAEKERIRERDCALAQETVRQLSSGQTLAVVGEKGERKVLDSNEVSSRLKASQEQEKKACEPLPPEEPEVEKKISSSEPKEDKNGTSKDVKSSESADSKNKSGKE